jgi:hypothetical protein
MAGIWLLAAANHKRCTVLLAAAGAAGNLGGFANAKSFRTMQTAYYYIAGSPLVYDSSNPRHTPNSTNYAAGPYDQKTCSTW